MKKTELESILLDCEKAKHFCECIQACDPCIALSQAQPATSRVLQAKSDFARTTPEEIHSNYQREQHQCLSSNFHALLPSLARKDPREALELLTERYRKYMTKNNARLLEDRINRLRLVSPLDSASRDLVADATDALATKREGPTKDADELTGDNIWATLFEHANYGGRSIFFNEWLDIVYKAVAELSSVGSNDCVSSDADPGQRMGDRRLCHLVSE